MLHNCFVRCLPEYELILNQVPKQNFNKNECIIPVMYNHPNIVEIFGVIQREGQMNTQVEIFMEDAGKVNNESIFTSCCNTK